MSIVVQFTLINSDFSQFNIPRSDTIFLCVMYCFVHSVPLLALILGHFLFGVSAGLLKVVVFLASYTSPSISQASFWVMCHTVVLKSPSVNTLRVAQGYGYILWHLLSYNKKISAFVDACHYLLLSFSPSSVFVHL